MPEVTAGHPAHPEAWDRVREAFARHNPGCVLGWGDVAGEAAIPSDRGIRYVWLARGTGAVHIPQGFHTQEGDGEPLPPHYAPDPPPQGLAAALASLRACPAGLPPAAAAAAAGILARHDGAAFRGDIMGELWRLREALGDDPAGWSPPAGARSSLAWLAEHAAAIGWSTAGEPAWEPIRAGDQLIAAPGARVHVRGTFSYWWIEDRGATATHCPAVRRLRYLRDTAGGCAPGFDAFRRLPLTWFSEPGLPAGDGRNRVNSHVVNIAAEQSRTHFHPGRPVGGGWPQCELYLVLDPAGLGLGTAGRSAQLHSFADVGDWSRHAALALEPADVVVIPPDTGHRGIDACVNVVTLPGFKPRNEIYVDALIARHGRGAPHNPAFDQAAAY